MVTKMKLALALCGSLVAGIGGLAAAQHVGGPKGAVIQKYDTNGDGKLDDQERAALRADMKARREAMKQKFDTNKDGKLDDQERAAMRDELATEAFKKIDTDGNGQISLEEFKQAGGKLFKHHARAGRAFRHRMLGGGGQP